VSDERGTGLLVARTQPVMTRGKPTRMPTVSGSWSTTMPRTTAMVVLK
jgi:hypothetical protein